MAKRKEIKPVAPELISVSELGRRAGVTRAAASLWLKTQEKWGIVLTQPSGRQGKLVDANDPLVRRYIENTLDKSKRPKQGAGEAAKKSANTLRKLQYQAEKLRLQNIALREKYVPREAAFELFDRLLELEVKIFEGFSDRILARIERELYCAITPQSREKAKKYLDDAIRDAHIANARIVEDFKKSAPKYAPEKTA